jgi:hypothetical protein
MLQRLSAQVRACHEQRRKPRAGRKRLRTLRLRPRASGLGVQSSRRSEA